MLSNSFPLLWEPPSSHRDEEVDRMTGKKREKVDPMKEEREGKVREVGYQAVWSLSSCKPGFGVDQLRDNCLETYWQSDGPQPHLVNIQFRRKTTIQDVCVYADFKLDESYTPSRISIRAGSHFHDLQEIEVVELSEPNGWVIIPLKDNTNQPLRTFLVQIAVLSNHQNGRDTHMRQIKVHSPVQTTCMSAMKLPPFSTVQFSSYSTISDGGVVLMTDYVVFAMGGGHPEPHDPQKIVI